MGIYNITFLYIYILWIVDVSDYVKETKSILEPHI
jgi:hypothetical protein